MEFITKFEKLKKKMDKVKTSALKESFAIQVNMTDDDCGGAFYIAYINDIFTVEPYDYHDHTAMITLNASDFEKIIDKKLDVDNAVSGGKVLIEGNVAHIKEAIDAIEKPAKKASSKTKAKTAKTAVKAESKTAKTAPKASGKKETKAETKPAEKAADKPETKTETKAEIKKASAKKTSAKDTK